MWIHKLLKFKSKYKYKKLLVEGIELFGQENASVQEYIYRELIAIEGNLVQKYIKMKELPMRRRATHKHCKVSVSKLSDGEKEKDMHRIKTTNKRRYANLNLLDPDDDQLMKNISVSFRGNRGVRFSNDIQTIEIDEGPVLRKSKFSELEDQTCKTIQNQLSEENIGSMNLPDKDSIKS